MQEFVVGYFIKLGSEKIALYKMPKDHPSGSLGSFGGKIEPGEKKDEALVRECFEETGLNISDVDIFWSLTKLVKDFGLIHMAFIVVPEQYDFELVLPDHELTNPRWYQLNDIPFGRMANGNRSYIWNMIKTAKLIMMK